MVQEPGYIYALSMIFFEDFYNDPNNLHKINYRSRLSIKEAALLLGLLIKKPIDLTTPLSPTHLIQLKDTTRCLLDELHIDVLEKNPVLKAMNVAAHQISRRDFLGNKHSLVEQIFYSNPGAYDFQYLANLEKRYKYDADWLKLKKFDIYKVKEYISIIRTVLTNKLQQVRKIDVNQVSAELLKLSKHEHPNEDWESHVNNMRPLMELYQFVYLQPNIGNPDIKGVYNRILDIFSIHKKDINNPWFWEFIELFSHIPSNTNNQTLHKIGDYNVINSKPIIKLNNDDYYIPSLFLLHEAIYEAPYYWILEDDKYTSKHNANRGIVGEEMVFDLLYPVFGNEHIYKNVQIQQSKKTIITDIDVLCVLRNKAICVQIKSKKLTVMARSGDEEALVRDFKAAIQDAYNQGVKSRLCILDGENITFKLDNGTTLNLTENIDEVYIMVVTIENYSAITTQSLVLLEKAENAPYPLVTTIFDLELLAHYLNDPYDFLYYIRQRSLLMNYYFSENEINYLGYHLVKKLWKLPSINLEYIDNEFAQLIDRNYYPYKMGIPISDIGDVVKSRWRNADFNQLCDDIKSSNSSKLPDILFSLFDWSGKAIDELIKQMHAIKNKTIHDGLSHSFSLMSYLKINISGISYYSLNSNDHTILTQNLLEFCKLRKYESKSNQWMAFGSLKDSKKLVDTVIFDTSSWEHDSDMDQIVNVLLKGSVQRVNKIGRNEKCLCGSSMKYKKCCGR